MAPAQEAYIRFYAELNELLPPHQRMKTIALPLEAPAPVSTFLRRFNVPDSEVDLILANRHSVDLSYLVQPGDHLSVFPVFESFDISSVLRLRERPLRVPRFVLDVHLGKLSSFLRMLGFDAYYKRMVQENELLTLSVEETRALLTRSRGLLERGGAPRAYLVRSEEPTQQLVEVVHRFDLLDSITPFQRCMRCNSLLSPVAKDAVLHELRERTREHIAQFQRCPGCNQIYWRGSHVQRMTKFIDEVRAQAEALRRAGLFL